MKYRGTQKVVITCEDFGPAVKKTIIKLKGNRRKEWCIR